MQDIDQIEESCVVYVEVGKLNPLDHSKIYILIIIELGIAMRTVHHLASISSNIHGISWDKHQQTSYLSKNVLWISHNQDILAVVHRDWSLQTITQHCTYLVQIAGWLETCATTSYMQWDSAYVECATWLLRMPFWLETNHICLRTSNHVSLSPWSGRPTSFRNQLLFTSTGTNHGSTYSAARWALNRIEQNDRHFCQFATCWDPTTTHTPPTTPQHCQCSPPKSDPGRSVKHCP